MKPKQTLQDIKYKRTVTITHWNIHFYNIDSRLRLRSWEVSERRTKKLLALLGQPMMFGIGMPYFWGFDRITPQMTLEEAKNV